jgi:tripartite-type tricarboxylate transporter receptor subunit TctC
LKSDVARLLLIVGWSGAALQEREGAVALARSVAVSFAVGVFLGVFGSTAGADPVADFYRGKTVRLLVAGSAGGGYDTVSRLVAKHIGRHIPGNPAVTVENMGGAGSLVMMNYIQNKAPHDGTVMGMPTTNVLFESKLHLSGATGGNVAFDINDVSWVGTPAQEPQVLFVWHTTPFHELADLQTHRMIVGAISVGTDTYILPSLMKQLLRTDVEIIPGYKGSPEILAAMERREVDASVALLANVTAGNSAYLKDGKIRIVLQFGRVRSSELPNVPTAVEWASSDADKRLLQFYGIKYDMSYPILLPGGVSAERVESLRSAFDATMADPLYREDASRVGVGLSPLSGRAMHDLMRKIDEFPDDLVARLRAMILAPSVK